MTGNLRGGSCSTLQECRTGLFGLLLLLGDSLEWAGFGETGLELYRLCRGKLEVPTEHFVFPGFFCVALTVFELGL